MLAVVLLAGAGLFVRGLLEQRASLDGLPAAEVLSAVIQLPEDRYPDDESRFRFYDQLLTSLEGTPGLQQAAITSNPPPAMAPALRINGKATRRLNPAPAHGSRVAISPGYLGLLDVPIVAGRDFDRRDGFDGQDSIVVTRDFASRVWPGQPALGKRLRVYPEQPPRNPGGAAGERPPPGRWLTVVGISGDLAQTPNELRPLPVFFIPYAPGAYGAMTIVLRSSGNPPRSLRRCAPPCGRSTPTAAWRTC